MTAKEFSDQFDVLWNNIASNEAPGINEYEKSVFLTKAQDEVLKNYFNGSNTKNNGFDGSSKRQIDFSTVMRNVQLIPATENSNSLPTMYDPRSIIYEIPSDLFLYVNEQILLKKSEEGQLSITVGIRQVRNIRYDEYTSLMSKPFKEPLKYQCWRLISSNDSGSFAEIILTSKDKTEYTKEDTEIVYSIRYIKRPRPILLADFSDSLGEDISINGFIGHGPTESNLNDILVTDNTEVCELDPILHEEILQRAVEIAKLTYQGDPNAINAIGQRSE